MDEIICTNQEQFDAIPDDYGGRIIIKFGTPYNRAVVNRRFRRSVVAWENSSVEAWENSSVEAWGNSQIYRKSRCARIATNGNAREVRAPASLIEYAEFYGLPLNDDAQTIALYKAVHRRSGEDYFVADYDASFKYVIGETVIPNTFDDDAAYLCGAGINLAHKAWAVAYGQSWRDLAILECECECEDVLAPEFTDGKVRARKVKVLREVPLEECGLLGKIIAKRIAKNEA